MTMANSMNERFHQSLQTLLNGMLESLEAQLREDEQRNRLNHADYEWPQTPEAAVARYEAAGDLGNPATQPYAPLIKSVPLSTD